MSPDQIDTRRGDPDGAATLLALAAAQERHARAGSAASTGDFLLPPALRLDDRTRVALTTLLRTIIGTIGDELRGHAAGLLRDRGQPGAAAALLGAAPGTIFDLVRGQVLADPDTACDLLDRVAMDLLAERLLAEDVSGGEAADAPARHAEHRDPVVARRAIALMAAEGLRRAPVDQPPYATDLSAETHVRFVWATAAAIAVAGNAVADNGGREPAVDRALADAALRSLAAHDEGERLEAAAVRLAAAIDPPVAQLPALLAQVLGERRVALFVALIAQGLRIAFDDARSIVVRPGDVRLWLALRALGSSRAAIARIGDMLAAADPRRDIEAFADLLDPLAAMAPADALAALAPLRLPRAYRDAIAGLDT